MKHFPSLKSLKTFEIFSRTLNCSHAAEQLNVTHSAVSQQIKNLELHLEINLVSKRENRLGLTPKGAKLASGLRECFLLLDEVVQSVSTKNHSETLKITMTPSFATEWMLPRLREFRLTYPEINLIIVPSFDLIDLHKENVDIALRYGEGQWAQCTSKLWKKSSFVVVVSSKALSNWDRSHPFDYTSLPWLQELGTNEVEEWLTSHKFSIAKKPESYFLPGHMILSAMREGCGIACTARMLIETDYNDGHIEILHENEGERSVLGYYLVTPHTKVKQSVQLVLDWFYNQ